MHVSAIIPVKDDSRLFACVASILGCRDEATTLEIIVVDDDSGPAFDEHLKGLPPEVVLMKVPGAGAYAARNRGIERATGELLLFTDADCRVHRGWVRASIEGLQAGAAIVQGHSGSVANDLLARLIQARYEAHLHRVRPGGATECDTRNLGVRREVFASLKFDEEFRRVGDTEFGLLAESASFKVAYCPSMRVDHDHDQDFRLFAAKQVCHGWGAQRLMHENPSLRWHGGLMRPASLVVERLSRVPGLRFGGQMLSAVSIATAGLLQRFAPHLPFQVALVGLTLVDKGAGLAGHLLFSPDSAEPSPSALLGRHLPRD